MLEVKQVFDHQPSIHNLYYLLLHVDLMNYSMDLLLMQLQCHYYNQLYLLLIL